MAWQEELVAITRILVNDIGESSELSDDRILQVLAVAGKYVQFDVNLEHGYKVDVVNSSITPDPTLDNDDIFISLVCLKAACIIDQSTYRTKAALEGVRASLGPASLSVAGQSAAWKSIIEHGACATYDELTSHWDVKEASAIRAVLSPFIGNKFDPRSVQHSYHNRNFFS